MSNQAFSHQPGTAIECLSIPITLHKEENKCGFKIGGGIDQDYRKSPQGCEKTWPIQKFITRENIVLLDQLHLARWTRFGTRVTRITVMIGVIRMTSSGGNLLEHFDGKRKVWWGSFTRIF